MGKLRLPVSSTLLLLFGLTNYYLLQQDIALFHWLGISPLHTPPSLPFNYFFKNYFSDVMWCLALCFTTKTFYQKQWIDGGESIFLFSIPVLSEVAQYLKLLPGVFDWYDLLVYAIVIIVFLFRYPTPFIQRKQIKLRFTSTVTAFLFFMMSIACAPPRSSYHAPKPLPCTTHKGLSYSPVLVSIYISGSYQMKDLSEVQRTLPNYLLGLLNNLSYAKYKMADGEKPNLSLYVNYTTDSYGHYGADIKGYVFDGDFHTWTDSNYVTWEKLDGEIARTVNWFISSGWCKNCPSPCSP